MRLAIQRNRLGQQVYDILYEELQRGEFRPGQHIAEAEICNRLEVSRTPVREALFRLEQSGLLVSRPNQGFFVASGSSQQVIEHYPILGALEALAVQLAPDWNRSDIEKLEAANRRILRKGAGPAPLWRADMEFHEHLVARCGNPSLLSMIESARTEIRRWDGGTRRGLVDPEKAFRAHKEIIARLAAGDSGDAARKIEAHWRAGVDTVTAWIEQQESENE